MPMLRPDRDLLNHLVDAEQAGGSPLQHGDIGRALRHTLLDLIAAGDDRATRLRDQMLDEALAKQSRERASRIFFFQIKHEGRRTLKPAMAGSRVRTADGLATRFYQAKLWVEMDREAHGRWLRELITSNKSLKLTIDVQTALQKLWDEQCPFATTAGEVCALAGLDPANIDLDRLKALIS